MNNKFSPYIIHWTTIKTFAVEPVIYLSVVMCSLKNTIRIIFCTSYQLRRGYFEEKSSYLSHLYPSHILSSSSCESFIFIWSSNNWRVETLRVFEFRVLIRLRTEINSESTLHMSRNQIKPQHSIEVLWLKVMEPGTQQGALGLEIPCTGQWPIYAEWRHLARG